MEYVKYSYRQMVRGLDGAVIADQMVQHVCTIEGGLVRRMEIRDAGSAGRLADV